MQRVTARFPVLETFSTKWKERKLRGVSALLSPQASVLHKNIRHCSRFCFWWFPDISRFLCIQISCYTHFQTSRLQISTYPDQFFEQEMQKLNGYDAMQIYLDIEVQSRCHLAGGKLGPLLVSIKTFSPHPSRFEISLL